MNFVPPEARIEVVKDDYFGTTIEDPYRWLENWKGAEAQEWVKAQAAYSEEVLKALPERDSLLKRISELSDAGPVLNSFKISAGRYFYFRRDSGENIPKLVVRTDITAPEKILIDPNSMTGSVHTVIDWFYPSPDGKLIAYGLSQGGSEESILYVMDVDNGEQFKEAITRTRFASVSWLEDNRSFLYSRLPEKAPDAPETERYTNMRCYIHQIGNDPDQDLAVLGRELNSQIELDQNDFVAVKTFHGSEWAVGLIIHGVLNELTAYAAPVKEILNDPANCKWIKVADVEDAVTGLEVKGETVYLRTHKDAPRYKVIATSLANPDLAQAKVVVAPSQVVIQEVMLVGNYLLTRDLDAGIGQVRKINLENGEIQALSLPFEGTITDWAGSESGSDLLLQITSWTESSKVFLYNLQTDKVENTNWRPASPIDFSEIEAHEVFAPSKDGTLIPLSIIHKKGLKLDGKNPTLMAGYGSYGLIGYPSSFMPSMLAWYERGGVFAAAHIRGGGEYGKEWHLAGYKLNKQKTIDDFIACGEYLIKQKYTSPERLAGEGTSAGGIPSGGALTQKPEMWAVMVMRVAVSNFLRFEFSENGPPNVPEFGTVTTEEGFKGLQIMDAYSKVQKGVKYPAVLLTAGLNDPRVVVWQVSKMTARLQAATASNKPILLRVETQAGHGMGSTRKQLDEELAEKLAFLLSQFNM